MTPAPHGAVNMRRTWLDQTTPAEPGNCGGCGEPTLTFHVRYYDPPVVLDDHDVAISRDLLEVLPCGHWLVDHCWTYLGEHLGWVRTCSRRRSWRRVRAEHTRCSRLASEYKHENGEAR